MSRPFDREFIAPFLLLSLFAARSAGAVPSDAAPEPASPEDIPAPRDGRGPETTAESPADRKQERGADSTAGVEASAEMQSAEAPSAAATASGTPTTEVTVLGARTRRTPGADYVISARHRERQKYDDPLAVLRMAPGVVARTEDGIGLRPNIGLRGANPDRSKKVALMEDGILVAPASYSAPAAYYFPMIQRMTQIRVVKGPGAIAYGPQTVGGAIDLVTRPIPSSLSGAADLALGAYGYGKAHAYAGFSDGRTGFLLEGVHLRSSGWKELPSGADTGFFRNEWMVKASHVLDPSARERHEFRLKATYSEESSNETYLGLSDADLRRNPNARYPASALDHMRWHRTMVVAEHEFRASEHLTITSAVYRSDFSRRWRKLNHFRGANLFDVLQEPTSPQNAIFYSVLKGEQDSSSPAETLFIGPNQRDFVSQGIQTRAKANLQTGAVSHRLEYGLRLHYDRIERHHSEDGFLMVGGELIPEGSPTIVTVFNEAWTESVALHAVDTMTWKGLSITPGVRIELMRSALVDKALGTREQGAAQALLPGIGVYQALTEELGVLAGVYRGFSPPPPGSTTLKPELSINYEAGVRHSQRHMRAEVIGYFNDYQNLTDVCTLSSGCLDADLDRQYPAGRARIYGLEAFVDRDIPVGPVKIPLLASYTLTHATFSRSFSSDDPIFGAVREGDEMPYVPRHQLSATLGVQAERAGVYASMLYVSRMREQAGSGAYDPKLTTDEEFNVDVSAQLRALSFLELYVNVRNVFDNQPLLARRPFGARPAAPRWAQVGAKISF
jgi:Fe(3+) dicitrate transport protein